jgi:hypothetical protein
LVGLNSSALVHSLVGIVFASVMGIIVFHFTCLPIVAACLKRLLRLVHSPAADSSPVNTTSRQATTSEVCLREPLLDD